LKKLTSSPKDFFCPALDLPSSDEKQPTYRRRFSTQKPTRERERERESWRESRERSEKSFFVLPKLRPQKKIQKKGVSSKDTSLSLSLSLCALPLCALCAREKSFSFLEKKSDDDEKRARRSETRFRAEIVGERIAE